MRISDRRASPYLVILLTSLFFSGSVLAETELRFGIYATDLASTLVKKFKPLLKHVEARMSENLGEPVKIKLVISKTYELGLDSLLNGDVDFARFGPASYVYAKAKIPELSILALEANKGKKVFHGIICVKSDSDIQSLQQLKGRSFAFGNVGSTIGRYLSQQELAKAGIKASDLSEFSYLGRHDTVGLAVAAGKFDAGALKESTFNKLLKEGKAIRSISKFDNVTKPWIASAMLSNRIKLALKKSLLETNIKKFHFVEGDDSDYLSIRTAINNNAVFFN